jgi:hypothetical protein
VGAAVPAAAPCSSGGSGRWGKGPGDARVARAPPTGARATQASAGVGRCAASPPVVPAYATVRGRQPRRVAQLRPPLLDRCGRHVHDGHRPRRLATQRSRSDPAWRRPWRSDAGPGTPARPARPRTDRPDRRIGRGRRAARTRGEDQRRPRVRPGRRPLRHRVRGPVRRGARARPAGTPVRRPRHRLHRLLRLGQPEPARHARPVRRAVRRDRVPVAHDREPDVAAGPGPGFVVADPALAAARLGDRRRTRTSR